MSVKTYQDFINSKSSVNAFVLDAIKEHKASEMYMTAKTADLYDHQKNELINNYVQKMFTASGHQLQDFTASNNKIASNYFRRLNTQRCAYSLGNGVSFVNPYGNDTTDRTGEDTTKEKLGATFDHDIYKAGYKALIHGVSFCFWNLNRVHVFPLTEFVPLWDEDDGTLKAGIRFWRLNYDSPLKAVLYEIDGYTKFSAKDSDDSFLEITDEKRAYKLKTRYVPADGTEEVIGEENYSSLPIVPLWGSDLKQSTLVGIKESIDSYDLIRSGFANDLSDCAEIYWLVENAGGMTDKELEKFRNLLKITHIANVDSDDGGKVNPYTQDIPYQARKEYLDMIRAGLYEDFGGLDVHTIAAGATNDHIDAAYQPLNENADDFEYQVTECIQQLLSLQGIEDTPIYTRNRVSNQKEQVEMVAMEAPYLNKETILRKLPNITPDEVNSILAQDETEGMDTFNETEEPEETEEVE
jgi:hypothetical protein